MAKKRRTGHMDLYQGLGRGRAEALGVANLVNLSTKRSVVIRQNAVSFARTAVCKKKMCSCSRLWALSGLQGRVTKRVVAGDIFNNAWKITGLSSA